MAERDIRGVIERGETIWIPIKRGDAINIDTLAQALFIGLSAQVAGVDDVSIDARPRVNVLGDQDIDFTPGGDDAFELLLRDMSLRNADHWFDADPFLTVGLDFGLQEARIA